MPVSNRDGQPTTRTSPEQIRPRLLLVGMHVPPDVGSRSVGESLAEGLRRCGFDVSLTSRRRSRASRVIDILVTAYLARNSYDIALVDVFGGRAFRWAEWVTWLMRLIGKPVVLTLHGGSIPELMRRTPRRVARLLSSAIAVTAPSRYLAEAVNALRPDVHVIPNPLALERYTYTKRKNPRAQLVWLRTFHQNYDPVLAVQVLARVAKYANDAQLTMIGPDKDGSLADVRAAAQRLGVLDRIRFTGGVPKADVPRHLAAGDIFINTTTIDNTPVSVLEAMAMGLPVVTTNVGGIPYLLEDGRDAILVPPHDADAMATAVRRLLTEPGLGEHLSRNARAKAEMAGWEAVMPHWEALLMGIASDRGFRTHEVISKVSVDPFRRIDQKI